MQALCLGFQYLNYFSVAFPSCKSLLHIELNLFVEPNVLISVRTSPTFLGAELLYLRLCLSFCPSLFLSIPIYFFLINA